MIVLLGVVFTLLKQNTCLLNLSACEHDDLERVYRRDEDRFQKDSNLKVRCLFQLSFLLTGIHTM